MDEKKKVKICWGIIIIAMIAIVSVICFCMYIDVQKANDRNTFLTKTFYSLHWNLPNGSSIHLNDHLPYPTGWFFSYRDGWYSTYATITGRYPFEDKDVMAWFNINTKETKIESV